MFYPSVDVFRRFVLSEMRGEMFPRDCRLAIKCVLSHSKFKSQVHKKRYYMLMKIRILIVLSTMSFTSIAASESADSLWMKANDAYSRGEYADAARGYELILNEAGESSELYYNLGNAYFKLNRLGPARLNYERAHRLDPSDPDIRHNLDFVEAVQTDKIDEVKDLFVTGLLDDIGNLLSGKGWTMLFFSLLACGLIALYFFVCSKTPRTRKLTFAGFAFLIMLGGASFYLGYRQRVGILDRSEAVIYAAEITVRSTPGDSGADLFIIHEGLKVRVIDKQGNYYRIILNDGKSQGWIPRDSAGII